jgi:hypothetical protein
MTNADDSANGRTSKVHCSPARGQCALRPRLGSSAGSEEEARERERPRISSRNVSLIAGLERLGASAGQIKHLIADQVRKPAQFVAEVMANGGSSEET